MILTVLTRTVEAVGKEHGPGGVRRLTLALADVRTNNWTLAQEFGITIFSVALMRRERDSLGVALKILSSRSRK